jgi:uncharacterized membrane protein YphA (DoxX/SURF4 family)
MHRSTAALLILLRLAIGWHFLFEGLHKVHTVYLGPTETNRPFSSEGYFREAPGPLGGVVRQGLGDPDENALARLTVQPVPEGKDLAIYESYKRMPIALDQDWDAYFSRFAEFYGLTDQQRGLAEAALKQAKAQTVEWLIRGKSEVKKVYSFGPQQITETNEQRIKDYRDQVQEVRDTLGQRQPSLGKDVARKALPELKAKVAQSRRELLADLDQQTQEMKTQLKTTLTADQKSLGTPPEPESGRLLFWIDWATRWGLTMIGACLLLGLLTRTNCLLAAGFLFMTYWCVPPFPWLPTPPINEGFYAYVNKNVVEMLALLVLATTHSGRWFGLDALLHSLLRSLFGHSNSRSGITGR